MFTTALAAVSPDLPRTNQFINLLEPKALSNMVFKVPTTIITAAESLSDNPASLAA